MAIALRRRGREGQGLGNGGVIRGEQDAPVRFPREQLVPGSDLQAVGHILREGSTHRAPGAACGDALDHERILSRFAHEYKPSLLDASRGLGDAPSSRPTAAVGSQLAAPYQPFVTSVTSPAPTTSGARLAALRCASPYFGGSMPHKRILWCGLLAGLFVPAPGSAQGGMSDAQFTRLAESAAPATISTHAAIARIDPKHKTVTQLRAGSNAFTCSVIPDGTAAPYCGDKNGWAWVAAAFP